MEIDQMVLILIKVMLLDKLVDTSFYSLYQYKLSVIARKIKLMKDIFGKIEVNLI
jgi:hypothetical protein